MAGVARELDLVVTTRHLDSIERAQNAASPFGTFGAFLYGEFITHELMSPRKFRDLIRRKLQNSSHREARCSTSAATSIL